MYVKHLFNIQPPKDAGFIFVKKGGVNEEELYNNDCFISNELDFF